MPIWAYLIAALAPSVIGALSGKGRATQESTQTVTTPARGYSSPMLPLMDMMGAQSLLGQLGQYSGAGMPGGVGGVNKGMLNAIMSMLSGQDFQDMLAYYRNPKASTQPTGPVYPAGSRTPFGYPTNLA